MRMCVNVDWQCAAHIQTCIYQYCNGWYSSVLHLLYLPLPCIWGEVKPIGRVYGAYRYSIIHVRYTTVVS